MDARPEGPSRHTNLCVPGLKARHASLCKLFLSAQPQLCCQFVLPLAFLCLFLGIDDFLLFLQHLFQDFALDVSGSQRPLRHGHVGFVPQAKGQLKVVVRDSKDATFDRSFAGRSDNLSITLSGSGSLDAANLRAKRATIVVSGAGDVTVNANEELDARVSGVGTIWYVGSPKLRSKVSGVGSIKQKFITH